ncbi:MAG: fused MFS/spermidine synthase [bacterium]
MNSSAISTFKLPASPSRRIARAVAKASLPEQTSIWLWLVTPMTSGAVIMALELTAFRLYAPYFGYSIYVWGSMISVVMAALAAGYALGGRIADRSRTDLPLYGIILASALYQLVIIFTMRLLLSRLAQDGDVTGPLLATLLIFALPMTALATVAPFVIRLLARAGHVGSTAGKIYSLSTVGSIGGTLATSFFLIPRLGTQMTMMIACVVSAVVGLTGLVAQRRAALLVILPMLALSFAPAATWSANTLWVSESAYNLVRVVRSGSRLLLTLNDEGVHTIRDERSTWTGHYYDDFAIGPILVPARRALVLGMGAGGSIASTRTVAPDIEIDAVEIDPKVVEASQRFFGLRPEKGRTAIHIADARPWLARSEDVYDLVHVDLYQGGPYIPFYLVTIEFFQSVRAHMSEDALLMMNVFDLSTNRELLSPTVATLKLVFPTLAVLPVGSGNYMVLAFSQEKSLSSIRDQLRHTEGADPVRQLAQKAASDIIDFVPPDGVGIFTDDHAPVEEITRRMLTQYQSHVR